MKLHKMSYVTQLNQPWYSSKQNKTFICLNLETHTIYKLEFEFIIKAFPWKLYQIGAEMIFFSLQLNTPRCYRRTGENESICFFFFCYSYSYSVISCDLSPSRYIFKKYYHCIAPSAVVAILMSNRLPFHKTDQDIESRCF